MCVHILIERDAFDRYVEVEAEQLARHHTITAEAQFQGHEIIKIQKHDEAVLDKLVFTQYNIKLCYRKVN